MRRRARFRRFVRLPPARRVLLVDAAFNLCLARLALRVLPFRWLRPFINRRVKGSEVVGSTRERLRADVAWAIGTAACHLPGRTACFPRAIAAQAMLRRRRVGTTLSYGVATTSERGHAAHVWVEDGDEGVVGFERKSWYRVLARYPEEQIAPEQLEAIDEEE